MRFFLEAVGGAELSARLVSIGPVTSDTLREHGLEPHVEASRHDVDGLVEALVGGRRRGRQPPLGLLDLGAGLAREELTVLLEGVRRLDEVWYAF